MSTSILIAGGYGVVGTEIARLLRKLYPDTFLWLAGRTPQKAAALADELGLAEGLLLDLQARHLTLPPHIKPDVVVSAVTDEKHLLLDTALQEGWAYVDFATSGQHLKDAIWMTLQADSPGPIAFVSNWTAGVPSVFAKALAEEMESVESVALDILYYGNDRGGPDTAGAVEEFAAPFLAWRNNQWVTLKPLREGKRVHFPSGHEGTTYLINLPDLTSLVQATKASSVHVRLGLDAPVTNVLSSLLVRSRVWDVLPHSVRKSLLYNPGEGAPHEIVVEVKGIKEGRETTQTATLLSPQGQAHLTAIGAVHAVERVLGLDGKAPQRAGAVFSEAIGDCERLQELLTLEGVQWTRTESS